MCTCVLPVLKVGESKYSDKKVSVTLSIISCLVYLLNELIHCSSSGQHIGVGSAEGSVGIYSRNLKVCNKLRVLSNGMQGEGEGKGSERKVLEVNAVSYIFFCSF